MKRNCSVLSGHGPLASDIEAVYNKLDMVDPDVQEAVTGGGLKSLFIQAVFFDGRCSLHSLIKDNAGLSAQGLSGVRHEYL